MNGVLSPQTVFVGDTAQFLFLLPEQEWYGLQQHVTAGVPLPLVHIAQNDAMTVQEVKIILRDKQPYLLITFIPWETGTVYFPSFSPLHIHTLLPAVHVASILESTGTAVLQPPKQPLLMPGTDYLLYTGAAAALIALIFLISSIVFAVKKLQSRYASGYSKKRMRVLKKKIKKLRTTMKKTVKNADACQKKSGLPYRNQPDTLRAVHTWYIEFEHVLRQYLCSLYEGCTQYAPECSLDDKSLEVFLSYTYRELTMLFHSIFPAEESVSDSLSLLCRSLEYNRFRLDEQETVQSYEQDAACFISDLLAMAEKAETAYAHLIAGTARKEEHSYA